MGWVDGIVGGTYEIDAHDVDELEWASAVHRARDVAAYEAAEPIRQAEHERSEFAFRLEEGGLDLDAAWAWGCSLGEALLGQTVEAAWSAHRAQWGLYDYGQIPPVLAGPFPAVHCHGDAVPCFCHVACGGRPPAYGPRPPVAGGAGVDDDREVTEVLAQAGFVLLPQRAHFASREEEIVVTDLVDTFWTRLGQLVAEMLRQAPDPDLHEMMLGMLQDKCSVYGTDYERWMRRKEDGGR